MNNENKNFEEEWAKQAIKGMSNTLEFFKNCYKVLKKYHYETMYPLIINKLLKSNDKFWEKIDEDTKQYRCVERFVEDVEGAINELVTKIKEAKYFSLNEEQTNRDLTSLYKEFNSFSEDYDLETNTLRTYKELNKNWADLDLIEFCYKNIEKISLLVDNQITNGETSFDKEPLMVEYISHLFALTLQGCQISISDDNQQINVSHF